MFFAFFGKYMHYFEPRPLDILYRYKTIVQENTYIMYGKSNSIGLRLAENKDMYKITRYIVLTDCKI